MAIRVENSDLSIKLAVKPKHPTRKAIDKVLGIKDSYEAGVVRETAVEKQFLDIIEITSARQAEALLETAYVALVVDGKYYPLPTSEDVYAQYALVIAGEAPTVEEDAEFGIPALSNFVVDMVTGGATSDTDISGKTLGELQIETEIYNGVMHGKLRPVTGYTGFSTIVAEQSGYFLPFHMLLADAQAAGYSDIKFFVVGGSGVEIAAVEGTNVIRLGNADMANRRTLGLKATLTATIDEEAVTAEIIVSFDNDIQIIEEASHIKADPYSENYLAYTAAKAAAADSDSSDVIDLDNNSSSSATVESDSSAATTV